jgi:hypothetical protein
MAPCILAGSLMAGPAFAACGIRDITNNLTRKTYQLVVTLSLYDYEIPCGAGGDFPDCRGTESTVMFCSWLIHSGNQASGTAKVRVTCPGEQENDQGVLTNHGQRPSRPESGNWPLPFYLDQDTSTFGGWPNLDPPVFELRRLGNSCDYLLVDTANSDGPVHQHPPYRVVFSSRNADTVIGMGSQTDPADRGDNYGSFTSFSGTH